MGGGLSIDTGPDPHRPLGRLELIAAALFLPVSVLLAQLQKQVTQAYPWSAPIGSAYFAASGGEIVDSRGLVRWIVNPLQTILPVHRTPKEVNVWLQTAVLWIGLIALVRMARAFLPDSWSLLTGALAALFIPWGFLLIGYGIAYPYDLPAFALSVACIALAFAGRFGWFALFLFIATLNKETSIWLVGVWAVLRFPSDATITRRRWAIEVLGLVSVFVAAYLGPRAVLGIASGNWLTISANAATDTGGTVSRWSLNLHELALRERSSLAQNIYWPLLIHIPALCFWRRLPREMKGAYLATPLFLIPMFFLGNLWELRLFNELLPLGALSCALVVRELLREQD